MIVRLGEDILDRAREVGPTSLASYVMVERHAARGTSINEVAKDLGVSRPTAAKALSSLGELKLVKRVDGLLFPNTPRVRKSYRLSYIFYRYILKNVVGEERKRPLTKWTRAKVANIQANGVTTLEELERYCRWWNREKAPRKNFGWGLFCCDSMLHEYATRPAAKKRPAKQPGRRDGDAATSHDQRSRELLRELARDAIRRKKAGERLGAGDREVLRQAREAGIIRRRKKEGTA